MLYHDCMSAQTVAIGVNLTTTAAVAVASVIVCRERLAFNIEIESVSE